jgi:hypothetical protein
MPAASLNTFDAEPLEQGERPAVGEEREAARPQRRQGGRVVEDLGVHARGRLTGTGRPGFGQHDRLVQGAVHVHLGQPVPGGRHVEQPERLDLVGHLPERTRGRGEQPRALAVERQEHVGGLELGQVWHDGGGVEEPLDLRDGAHRDAAGDGPPRSTKSAGRSTSITSPRARWSSG